MRDHFIERLIDLALDEDLGSAGDVTTDALVQSRATGRAELWAKEEMVLSGLTVFEQVFKRLDPTVEVDFDLGDGDKTLKKQRVAKLEGPLRALLAGERTALNFVQRMSGIATLTARAVAVVSTVRGAKLRVLDTRKTTPGLRSLSKAAVRHGGGSNHRIGLFDGVLIKDNHIAAVGGSVREALRRARERVPRLVKIEVEVTSLGQLSEAIDAGADLVMLDNMTDAQVVEAVQLADGRCELEVSGGITLERLPTLAKFGVDYVSMGSLTHSARAMDLSLEIMTPRESSKPRLRVR
ncbi:MAG: carboxylating nicotinate-nucleotide diphosphorylase [Myxococcaceae bacterium]|nr:carboxylating nicotinate-nucleotide diphosphorylase [Myxococcaceae bacterium]MCA3011137.1 carboxylating nicotinate-nucleotide diphosphorylase [Myxococcaceae bacterium]